MVESDLERVVEIEEETFPVPFTRGLFEKFMRHECFYCYVILISGKIGGYAVYSVAADEVDLLNIAIAKPEQHKGYGTQLMDHVLSHSAELGGKRIYLEVRPSNKAAQAFYEKYGFFQVGVRRGYYQDSGEDALVYMKVMR